MVEFTTTSVYLYRNIHSFTHIHTSDVCYYKLMPYRFIPFVNGNIYHVFNRGVEKRLVYLEERDYKRFIQTLYFYQFRGPKSRFSEYLRSKKNKQFQQNPKIIEIISYCLMPNHFHLLIKQLEDGGIQELVKKVVDSYTKYFNIKYNRVGHLFQGQFKAKLVESEEQLVHISRYIHLNPFVASLTQDLNTYLYSSYPTFVHLVSDSISNPDIVLNLFKDFESYRKFVLDQRDYAKELEKIKHLILDD